jgi:hypothetical protein
MCRARITVESLINKLKIIKPDLTAVSKYINKQGKLIYLLENNLNEYISYKEKIILKDNFGLLYNILVGSALKKCEVSIRSCINPCFYFKTISEHLHKNKYSYKKSIYKDTHKKVIIICPEHGEFLQSPEHHLKGNGCKKCASENHTGSYTAVYKHNPELKVFIYFFECCNHTEKFYKVGLSINPFKRICTIPYNVKILGYTEGAIKDLYPLEQEYHKKFKKMSINYKPYKYFAGWTECFKIPTK